MGNCGYHHKGHVASGSIGSGANHYKGIMQITFYKSALCPRCYLAGKYLRELTSNQPGIEIETVDVLQAPTRLLADGIRMIPTLKIGNRQLSGWFLRKNTIREFLAATEQTGSL